MSATILYTDHEGRRMLDTRNAPQEAAIGLCVRQGSVSVPEIVAEMTRVTGRPVSEATVKTSISAARGKWGLFQSMGPRGATRYVLAHPFRDGWVFIDGTFSELDPKHAPPASSIPLMNALWACRYQYYSLHATEQEKREKVRKLFPTHNEASA